MNNQHKFIKEFLKLCSKFDVSIVLSTRSIPNCVCDCKGSSAFAELNIDGNKIALSPDCLDGASKSEDLDIIDYFQKELDMYRETWISS